MEQHLKPSDNVWLDTNLYVGVQNRSILPGDPHKGTLSLSMLTNKPLRWIFSFSYKVVRLNGTGV